MNTFLQFVCFELLGESIRPETQPGESYWHCPRCESDSFHTLPDRGNHDHKFKCWVCLFWGDEYDLLKHLYPYETFARRSARVAQLRAEWERQSEGATTFDDNNCASNSAALTRSAKTRTAVTHSRKRTAKPRTVHRSVTHHPLSSVDCPDVDSFNVGWESEDGWPWEPGPALTRVLQTLPDDDAAMVLNRIAQAETKLAEMEFHLSNVKDGLQHLIHCNDPDCDFAVCREKRGRLMIRKQRTG